MASKKVKAGTPIGFDSLEPSFDVPVVARPGRGKAGTSDLDLADRPQTRLKLLALRAYLPVWFGVISNRAEPEAFYLDLFAGDGIYPDGAGTAEGSPVIACAAAADAVASARARGRDWTPHLRFVEESPAAADILRGELDRFRGLVDAQVITGTAEAVLPRLVEQSAGSPTLAFFDPWGYKGVTYEMVTAFARPGLNEALISFDTQAVVRNVGAGQPDGLSAFSGGDWWKAHVTGTTIDLDAYLRELCRRYARRFPYAGVEPFRFPERHAFRVVAQVCGSVVGRDEWMRATTKARKAMGLLSDAFEEINRQLVCDQVIARWSGLAGRSMTRRDALAELTGLNCDQPSLDQVLAFLAERGLVTWENKVARAGHPYQLFRFSRPWPAGLAWDGVKRAAPARAAKVASPATTSANVNSTASRF